MSGTLARAPRASTKRKTEKSAAALSPSRSCNFSWDNAHQTTDDLALARQATEKSACLLLPLSSKCPLGLFLWILLSAQVSTNLATSWPAKGLKAVCQQSL